MGERVIREQRTVYRVPGGRSRFTASAAYREAARVAIREACTCRYETDTGYSEQCRFHGERFDGYAYDHPDAVALREPRDYDSPGQLHGLRGEQVSLAEGGYSIGDGGRAYYTLVRERLARWLRWAAREEVGHG